MKAAAFFDLDRTLISGASGYHWSRAATKAGLMKRRTLAEHAYRNIRFRLSGSTDAATDRVMAQLSELIRGKPVADFERLGPEVVAAVVKRVYPQVLELAREHQREGRAVYIVSAAGEDTVALIAAELGLDGALGTRMARDGDFYTGEIEVFTYREGKARALREFAEENGIDLTASHAYSDSESDLPFLRAVGHPVAVNPDKALAAIALAEGWPILRFKRR
ncbi:MAG TPA: HAD-IB family hydrolase [Baekduia sp.]|nr:HAD-IB family hydrolase [Baekduia sp.]